MADAPTVILVRPTEEGNVGAVARAMANTGLSRLVLVEPAVQIGQGARARAVNAGGVLDRAQRRPSLEAALAPFQRVIGTSSHRQRMSRTPVLVPRELASHLSRGGAATALVFGPERSGLTTEELALCGTIVCIPTAQEQPTLNLAQAVLLVAHELFLAQGQHSAQSGAGSRQATAGEVAGLLEHLDSVLHQVGFARDSTYQGVLLDLKRLAGRAAMTDREVVILRGLCRRVEHALGPCEAVKQASEKRKWGAKSS